MLLHIPSKKKWPLSGRMLKSLGRLPPPLFGLLPPKWSKGQNYGNDTEHILTQEMIIISCMGGREGGGPPKAALAGRPDAHLASVRRL